MNLIRAAVRCARTERLHLPLLARIVSVCDAYDALTSDRPYRSRFSSTEALAILRGGAGGQWDPELVDLIARPARGEVA